MTLVQESSTSATISSRSSSSPMRSDSWQECSAERRILQTMTTLPKIRTSGCCQGSEWIYGRRKITPSCLCTRQISRTCREFSRKTQWLKPSRVLRSLSSCGEDQRDLPWRFTDVTPTYTLLLCFHFLDMIHGHSWTGLDLKYWWTQHST
ncbi:hypothetical protein DL95DRAFT_384440 [Leptodontidium sp. 2 PMI_412]|nr:hypothetical protein DL95DRAFT_384440 [Leptodontidium sp. 2 PMI_412]